MQDGGVEGCEGGLRIRLLWRLGGRGERVGDVVLLFAQLRARLGEREGADWICERRGTGRVIRRKRRFAAVVLRGRVCGFGEWGGAGEVEAGHAGSADEGDIPLKLGCAVFLLFEAIVIGRFFFDIPFVIAVYVPKTCSW